MNPVSSAPSAAQIATSAVRQSLDHLAQDAHVVANSTDLTSRDTVHALVDAKQQVLYTQAGAKVISVADLMTGALLEVSG